MYSRAQLARGLRNPRVVGRELNRLVHTRGYARRFNPNGVDVLEEDWDNLVILDACRYDYFDRVADLDAEVERRESLGSATYDFVRATFAGEELLDTVYVGANTWYLKLMDEIDSRIHHFVDLQRGGDDVEFVDEELRVVTPETVSRHALRAAERFPKKRLVVHYLQPHHPFLDSELFTEQSSSLIEVVEAAQPGVTVEDVRRAYRRNLEAVLPSVRRLVEALEGTTVITSDHGEMLGERHRYVPIRDFGHHAGIFNDETVGVPWAVVEGDRRKEVVAEPPPEPVRADAERVDEQLRSLGYVV